MAITAILDGMDVPARAKCSMTAPVRKGTAATRPCPKQATAMVQEPDKQPQPVCTFHLGVIRRANKREESGLSDRASKRMASEHYRAVDRDIEAKLAIPPRLRIEESAPLHIRPNYRQWLLALAGIEGEDGA